MVSRPSHTAPAEGSGTFRRGNVRHVRPYTYVFKAHAKRRWLGRRVLEVMAEEFSGHLTSDYLAAAARDGRVRINGTPCVPDATFRDGDVLEHETVRDEPPVIAPPATEWVLRITDELLVVNKPCTVPVHAAGRFRHNTVISILEEELGAMLLTAEGAAARRGRASPSGLLFNVHRLDRETSGLLMLARSSETARRFADAFAAGRIRKRYLARVAGLFPPGVHVVNAALLRSVEAGVGRNCVHPEGKPAETGFERLAYEPRSDTSIVLCRPTTGRTHQIRLHLQWLGHPISDDPLYGGTRGEARSHNGLFAPRAPAGAAPATAADVGGCTPPERAADASATHGPDGGSVRLDDADMSDAATSAAGARIFLHALDYRCDDPPRPWHYCAPLPVWAKGVIRAESIGDGYDEPARWAATPDADCHRTHPAGDTGRCETGVTAQRPPG